MKIAIMQPYFLPYIGYFQLISAVDVFVVYDNIKYTKKGWINRNRMLLNGSDAVFSLPLKADSDSLDIVERNLSKDFNRKKMLAKFEGAYKKSPYFKNVYPLLEKIVLSSEQNLFNYILNSLKEVCGYLKIKTQLCVSSSVSIDHRLKAQDKVIELCRAMGAEKYFNPKGGVDLYCHNDFNSNGIELKFLVPDYYEYRQFGNEFVPWLSIVDVMMFNSIENIQTYLNQGYSLNDCLSEDKL